MRTTGTKKKPTHRCYYLIKTKLILESALHLLEIEAEHPTKIRPSPQVPKSAEPISKLHWSGKFSKRDLIELITALDQLGAIDLMSGEKASFKTLVSAFEVLFNVTLSYPHQQREDVLSRKIKTTQFINKMANAVVEKSQK